MRTTFAGYPLCGEVVCSFVGCRKTPLRPPPPLQRVQRKPPSPKSSRHCTMPPQAAKQVREKTNWLIHMLYIRQDYDQCLEKIEEALKGCNGMAECAPLPATATHSHCVACSHGVTVACRPDLRQGTHQAAARRDPGLAAALPGGDLPQPAQHLQPEAGRPLALPPGQAQGGARRVRGGAAHRHR